MITDLYGLIEERGIVHPTTVEWFRGEGSTVWMLVEGHPWWRPEKAALNSKILFCFQDIFEASFTSSWFAEDGDQEDLEEFSLAPLVDEPWFFGAQSSVFASAPLADPLAVLLSLEDAILRFNSPQLLTDHLRVTGGVSEFVERCRSSTYFVCGAADPICEIVAAQLKLQGVSHTVVPAGPETRTGFIVRWWDGYLCCESAKAIWGADLSTALAKIVPNSGTAE